MQSPNRPTVAHGSKGSVRGHSLLRHRSQSYQILLPEVAANPTVQGRPGFPLASSAQQSLTNRASWRKWAYQIHQKGKKIALARLDEIW